MSKWLLFLLQLLLIVYTSCERCNYQRNYDYYQITKKWWRDGREPRICIHLWTCSELTSMDIYNSESQCFSIVSSNITTLLSMEKNLNTWGVKLDSNYIKHLKNDSFESLVYLEEVSARHNNINILPDRLFISNSNLKIVDLSYNIINTIGNTTFSDSIEYLNLMYNKLEKLNFLLPDSLINLEISFNVISYILETSFQKTTHLNTLNVSNNMLTTLSPSVLASCKNLLELNLSSNSLSSLNFALPASLTDIDFSFNSIVLTDKKTFFVLKHLVNIFLQNNNITTLPKDLFVSSHNLQCLRLDANNLKTVNFSLPESLINLNLSYNSISRIENNSFSKLTYLVHLNLNNNLLRNLPLGCFYALNLLNILHLSNNNVILTYGVFGGLKNLKELHIASNSIKSLPVLSLNDLKRLSSLDIAYNSISTLNVTDITEHLNYLRSMRLEGNMFKCSHLSKLIAQFNKRLVEVEEGQQFFESNVRGIGCINDNQEFISADKDARENQESTLKDITEMKVFIKEVITEWSNRSKQLQEVLQVNAAKDNTSQRDTNFSYYTTVFQTILLLGVFITGILILLIKYAQHRKDNRRAISLTEMRSYCNADY